MKILFLTRRFYPDIGGVEKHVLEISKRFADQGHMITIITQSQNLHKKKFLHKNINIYRIDKHGKQNEKIFIWKWFWKNKKLLLNADVIHCHDVFFWYLPFRFLYPQKPVFTTFHGYESYPIKKKAIIVRKISEVLSWGNICIGDFITKWYGTKPTVVSYGAVEVKSHQVIKSSSKKKLEDFRLHDLKTPSAVFFGRLDEQTGIKTYSKAFAILKKNFPKFRLLVVGDGKYRRFLSNDIKVKGFQKNPEQYFEKYRFAFVSRYLSILEAFAAKRLVFAVYDNPVKEDYLRMTPYAKFMIITKDPKELARKVEFFITHPKLEKKMVDGAYHYVKKQTWKTVIQMYLQLWKM